VTATATVTGSAGGPSQILDVPRRGTADPANDAAGQGLADPPAANVAAARAGALDACTRAPASTRTVACSSRPCGSVAVPHNDTTTVSSRSAVPARSICRPDDAPERAGRIGVGAMAQDDVQQQQGDRWVGRLLGQQFEAELGSIMGCGRPTVNSSSPRSRMTWPSPVKFGRPCVVAPTGKPRSAAAGCSSGCRPGRWPPRAWPSVSPETSGMVTPGATRMWLRTRSPVRWATAAAMTRAAAHPVSSRGNSTRG